MPQALATVRQQTWPHVQIIVADDGSDDNTAELVASMADVCYLRQEHAGQGAARNLGLRHAEGAYICSLDSDDLWDPDFIESSVTALRTLNADFVFSNWVEQFDDGHCTTSHFESVYGWSRYPESDLSGWRVMEPDETRSIYVESCISPSSSLMLPRALLADGWSEDLKIGDDRCLLLSLVLSRPCRVAVSTQPRWVKRILGDNISYVRGVMGAKRYLSVRDFYVLLSRFSPIMKRPERAWFYAKIAFNKIVLARWEMTESRVSLVPGLLFGALGCMVRAVLLSPAVVIKCVRELEKRNRNRRRDDVQRHQAVVFEPGPAEQPERVL